MGTGVAKSQNGILVHGQLVVKSTCPYQGTTCPYRNKYKGKICEHNVLINAFSMLSR